MVLHTLEPLSIIRDKASRATIATCISTALTLHPPQLLPATTAFFHALNRYEHIAVPLAEILALLSAANDHSAACLSHLIQEIATVSEQHIVNDPTAAKSIAAFIARLSELCPAVLRGHLAVLLKHLNVDSYLLRNGILHLITALIKNKPQHDDPLLDILLERAAADTHAFTRSKAVQMWVGLVQAEAVPHKLYPTLAILAAGRLDDKAAAVRKAAAILMTALLQNNPFGPVLKGDQFREKLKQFTEQEEEEEEVEKDIANENNEDDNESTTTALDEEMQEATDEENGSVEDINPDADSETDANKDIRIELERAQGEEADKKPELSQEELKRRYYATAVAFITNVEDSLDTFYQLLRSKSITDVSEAVSFLITAVRFQLQSAERQAVSKMLPLILRKEPNIREAAAQAYFRLLAPSATTQLRSEKDSALFIAKGLVSMGIGSTTGELACLESLILRMCNEKDEEPFINTAVIAVLWDMFAGRIPGATDEQRQVALILVGMIAGEKTESLQSRIDLIESVGLTNPLFARWSCAALSKMPAQSDADGRLSKRLAELTKQSVDLPTVEQALTAIYTLSTEPENIVSDIVSSMASELHANPTTVKVKHLARFLVVIGHVAVKQLVRIETLASQIRHGLSNQGRKDGNNEEEQAAAEADKAVELAEKELVSPKSLLGRYGRMCRAIAVDKEAPSELQASGVLCMAKLMCVQEGFCKENLRVLFSILSSSPEPLVRSNTVTALGDLAFRFPNLVEPWSSHIYGALKDEDVKVRKSTLMALTHLILNDMIKIKGHVVGLAVRMLDENERIADLAKLFFHELARKSSNAIYNVLPDTISCMSKMKDLSSDSFKEVITFLIGLMDKERHSDGMIEKLCHRFRSSESERETRDLAYCISLLNMSERGYKKLNDNFKFYSAALVDDVVHGSILKAISKANKPGSSTKNSQTLAELNGKIERVRKSVEAETPLSDDVNSVSQTSKRETKRRGQRESTKIEAESEKVQDVSEKENTPPPRNAKPQRNNARRKVVRKIVIEEDESEGEEEDIVYADEESDEE